MSLNESSLSCQDTLAYLTGYEAAFLIKKVSLFSPQKM